MFIVLTSCYRTVLKFYFTGHTKSLVWQDTTIKSTREAHREGLSTGLKNPTGKGRRLIIGHIGMSDLLWLNHFAFMVQE